jgi:hypothetical protein
MFCDLNPFSTNFLLISILFKRIKQKPDQVAIRDKAQLTEHEDDQIHFYVCDLKFKLGSYIGSNRLTD